MQPEGSLPHLQVYATCLYPEQDRSSPYLQILLPEDSSYYYTPIYAWVSPVVSFPQVSPPNLCTCLSPLPYMQHAPPISFFWILSPEQYWVRSTNQSNGARASPCFRLFLIGNMSDKFLPIWTLLYISVRNIFISLARFMGILHWMRILYMSSLLTES